MIFLMTLVGMNMNDWMKWWISSWNSKRPIFCLVQLDDDPNLYMGNGGFIIISIQYKMVGFQFPGCNLGRPGLI